MGKRFMCHQLCKENEIYYLSKNDDKSKQWVMTKVNTYILLKTTLNRNNNSYYIYFFK